MRSRNETRSLLSEWFASAEGIDGMYVTCDAEPDLADMDEFYRKCASGELTDTLARIAKLDLESPTRH